MIGGDLLKNQEIRYKHKEETKKDYSTGDAYTDSATVGAALRLDDMINLVSYRVPTTYYCMPLFPVAWVEILYYNSVTESK